MCFATNQMTGAKDEIALAADPKYQSVRLFTISPTNSPVPAADPKVMQTWVSANSTTVGGGATPADRKAFTYFSAVCWLQGRHLFDELGGQVPVGLLTSAVGGTRIHCWSSGDALDQCPQSLPAGVNRSKSDSDLWNTMVSEACDGAPFSFRHLSFAARLVYLTEERCVQIVPLLPMRFRFAVWLQSESDVCAKDGACIAQRGATYYSCAIKAMISDWRAKFGLPLPFLWVQISPWEGHEAATSTYELPAMRLGQMAANELPLTAVATAVDLGPNATAKGWDSGDEHGPDPWGNVHFRNKGPLGPRLASCAMNVVYGNRSVVYRGPEATTATATATAGVVVKFDPATVSGGLELRARRCPYEVLKTEAHFSKETPDCRANIDDCIKKCGWWEIELGGKKWVNATAAIAGPDSVTLSAPPSLAAAGAAAATGARYLYADWPVPTLYNGAGFPALPFFLNVSSSAA
eukprot:SAG22_NODE_460_length_10218_cov_5.663109_3_plen_464_part_00